MAMAVGTVLGKLGRSKSIRSNGRLIMLGNFETPAINFSMAPTVCASPHHPFGYQNKADNHLGSFKKQKRFYYHLDFGGLGPARFATEQLKKIKNVQLHSVRVLSVKAVNVRSPKYDSSYNLLLEAVDAGVMKYYEAKVSLNSSYGMWLKEFCLLIDNRKPATLYHHLDNFFGAFPY